MLKMPGYLIPVSVCAEMLVFSIGGSFNCGNKIRGFFKIIVKCCGLMIIA